MKLCQNHDISFELSNYEQQVQKFLETCSFFFCTEPRPIKALKIKLKQSSHIQKKMFKISFILPVTHRNNEMVIDRTNEVFGAI